MHRHGKQKINFWDGSASEKFLLVVPIFYMYVFFTKKLSQNFSQLFTQSQAIGHIEGGRWGKQYWQFSTCLGLLLLLQPYAPRLGYWLFAGFLASVEDNRVSNKKFSNLVSNLLIEYSPYV